MRFTEFKSIIDLVNKFPNEQSCIDYLANLRWVNGIVSPFDETSKVYVCKGNKYRCKNTGKYFNVRTGTMFDDTKLPLQKWFMAIYLMASHKKGISSYQLARDLGITQKSTWFMLHRIRYSFGHENVQPILKGTVEIDETYIGGKTTNKHKAERDRRNAKGTGSINLAPVFGMLERDGELRTWAVPFASGATLKPIIREFVSKDAIIITDGFGAYSGLHKEFKEHGIVRHDQKEFVRGIYHTNTIEGFWSMLKRGIIGIYHFVSPKHLDQYLTEFTYRYNTREYSESHRFALVLSNAGNKRLRYNKLVNR